MWVILLINLVCAFVSGYTVGYLRGYNRAREDKVKLTKEVCPSCDGYGHRMDINDAHAIRRDACELCRRTGSLDRYVELQRLTWRFWNWQGK